MPKPFAHSFSKVQIVGLAAFLGERIIIGRVSGAKEVCAWSQTHFLYFLFDMIT